MDTTSNEISPINIVMIIYYSVEITEKVIDRINDVTKYPFNLICGDNLSPNSEAMREMLTRKVEEGKVHKAYFYGENYMTSILNHMVQDNMNDSKFTIITDYDCLLPDTLEDCWLETFVNYFDENEKVIGMGFKSKNANLSNGGKHKRKDAISPTGDFCINDRSGKYRCMFNAHYFAIRNDILKQYLKKPRPIVDGEIRKFIDQIRKRDNYNYLLARYDKVPVVNLSSDLCGVTSINKDIKPDRRYLKLRQQVLRGGKNKQGRSLLGYYKPKKFEVISGDS